MPKISVIIPLFNKVDFIKEAIDSVLNQTFQDFEIIVVDDGSTDGSQEIVKSYTDKRIRFYQNEKNLGTAENANRCIELATAPYIARLDADDVMLNNRLAIQYDFMEQHPEIGISSGSLELFGALNEIKHLPLRPKQCFAELLFDTPIAQGASILRKEIIEENNLRYINTGYNVGEDWLMWYRLSKVTQFSNVEDRLIRYRIHEGNVTGKNNHGYYASRKVVYEYMFKDLGLPLDKIDIHFCTKFHFVNKVDAKMISEFYEWVSYLKKWNSENRKFEADYFENRLNVIWNRFFYFIAPYGLGPVRRYFKLSGYNHSKMMYFLKIKIKG